jgi:hypothetical protein
VDYYCPQEEGFVGHFHQFEQPAAAELQPELLVQVAHLIIEQPVHGQLLNIFHKSKVYQRQQIPPNVFLLYTKACLAI